MRVDPVHLGFAPLGLARPAVADHAPQEVVSVAEDVGRHGHDVADAPLGRISPVVDGGLGVLDDDARRRDFGGPRSGALLDVSRGGGHGAKVSTDPYLVNPRSSYPDGRVGRIWESPR